MTRRRTNATTAVLVSDRAAANGRLRYSGLPQGVYEVNDTDFSGSVLPSAQGCLSLCWSLSHRS